MEKSRVIGVYKITYKNGFVQEKNLISKSDFYNIIVPYQDKINDLVIGGFKKEASELKKQLKKWFGTSWFTDDSPLFKASITGLLCLGENQGRCHKCEVKLIENV